MVNRTYLFLLVQEVHEDPGQAPPSTSHPEGPVPAPSAPEPAPAASSQAEKAIPSKSLLDWLRQQADYSLEVPGFGAVSVALPDTATSFPLAGGVFDKECAQGRSGKFRGDLCQPEHHFKVLFIGCCFKFKFSLSFLVTEITAHGGVLYRVVVQNLRRTEFAQTRRPCPPERPRQTLSAHRSLCVA